MRCPKCHYLSFEPEPRCRNCGYGLSLDDGDLFLRNDEPAGASLVDLSLQPIAEAAPQVAVSSGGVEATPPMSMLAAVAERAPDMVPGADEEQLPVQPAAPVRPPVRPAPTTELPLFVRGLASTAGHLAEASETQPLVAVPAAPRPPLAVRRKAGDTPASRPRVAGSSASRKIGPLDRDLLEGLQQLETKVRQNAQAEYRSSDAPRVGAGKRLAAAAVDAVLLGSLGVVVMWATLRWTDLPVDRALMLPVLVPTTLLVLLLGVLYLLMFTAAGGQTLGKMALGLRVVGDEPTGQVSPALTVRQALVRAVLSVPSVLVAGAGFVPALVGDERAVHDRLAGTRVVRA